LERVCWWDVSTANHSFMTGRLALSLQAALCLLAPPIQSAELPDGPGKPIILRTCVGCHKAEEFMAYRLSKEQYQAAVYRMLDRGAQATTAELDIVAEYLFKNFPKAEDATKINVNKAPAEEIEKGLALTAKEAEAIVRYRERHGDFRTWGDLLVIYGVDGRKIQAAKDRMSF
jgi:competence ComEA-like helix-hairpin-helix protein